MKKKLKRILKDERIKKLIIIALAILVASITTSFCFGIKKAEGGDESSCPSCEEKTEKAVVKADEAEDEEDGEDADAEDLTADVEENEDEDEEGEDPSKDKEKLKKAKKARKRVPEAPFECKLTGKLEDDVKTLVSILEKQHKKLAKQDQEIDDLKDEVKDYKKQTTDLSKAMIKMGQEISAILKRFSVTQETQIALSNPNLTPETMEQALRELTAKKDELLSAISQRMSLLQDKVVGLRRLTPQQEAKIKEEILKFRAELDEVAMRAKLIEARRTQVTGQQPVKPFGTETQATQNPAQGQEMAQPLAQNQQDQYRAFLVALLRKGGGTRGGREPQFGATAFAPEPNRTPAIPQGQRPPLTPRGQRGIIGVE